jgi:hypothetical protein
MRIRSVIAITVLLFAGAAPGIAADVPFAPEIRSFSGSPLLLEIGIPDSSPEPRDISVSSAGSTLVYRVPAEPERERIDLAVSPYFEPGVYALELDAGSLGRAEYRVGFVDWVWGRDNLRFGNNGDYESVIGSYGEILESWIDARFGAVGVPQTVALIEFMYQFFGARSGRCYAFAGSELRYWLWPEQLPSYYRKAYDLRLRSTINQRALNYLQLDMAFAHFLEDGNDFRPFDAPDPTEVGGTLHEVIAAIEHGVPAVIGLMGPSLHHAMLVYGFIENRGAGYTDLIVANNWKAEEETNLRSRNAEYVRVYHEPPADPEVALVDWYYSEGSRNKEITRFFRVEVQEDFTHDPAVFAAVVDARMADLRGRNRAIVVVEDAARASVTDGDLVTGYAPGRKEELEGVVLDKVNRSYLFEVPADAELTLDFVDSNGTRVLYFHPGDEPGAETGWVSVTPAPEDDETVRRQVVLGTIAPNWDAVASTE